MSEADNVMAALSEGMRRSEERAMNDPDHPGDRKAAQEEQARLQDKAAMARFMEEAAKQNSPLNKSLQAAIAGLEGITASSGVSFVGAKPRERGGHGGLGF
jgi:hypothetical protein